ncbi:hypothetical protein ACYUJ6_00045 [Clostridium sp. JNZ X4-2]
MIVMIVLKKIGSNEQIKERLERGAELTSVSEHHSERLDEEM